MDKKLDVLIREHPEIQDSGQDSVIRELIRKQNFLTAEQYMNDLIQPNGGSLIHLTLNPAEPINHLRRFWDDYARNYSAVTNSAMEDSLQDNLIRMHRSFNPGGQELIDSWMKPDERYDEEKVKNILERLGWDSFLVESYEQTQVKDVEVFQATYANSHYGSWNVQHYVAAFGSAIHSAGRQQGRPMYVAILRNPETCDSLLRRFHQLENVCEQGSKLILLDYALTTADRHGLAEKIKRREEGFSSSYPYLVLDRVALVFLADYYDATSVNRVLMSIGMPFSFYQPYAPRSATLLPPEMFIGRKNELTLLKELPSKCNLIYGGRQLGKSALLKKVCADVDNGDNKRAIWMELKNDNIHSAARKISAELIRVGVLGEEALTEDWNSLTEYISIRLSGPVTPRLDCLILLLDEADDFLRDCENCNYMPVDALKKLQEKYPSRFNFVLAGLHDVARFSQKALVGNSPVPQLESINVEPFDTDAGMKLLTEPLGYLGFALQDTQLAAEILATTNNFPGLIQLYCKKLIESLRNSDYAGYNSTRTPPYVISEDHIRYILADENFSQEIRNKLVMTLTSDERTDIGYYLPLALLLSLLQKQEDPMELEQSGEEIGYSAARIQKEAQELAVGRIANLELERIDTLLQEMKLLNVLRSCSEPHTYRFSNKNFSDLLGTQDDVLTELSKYEGG